MLASASPRRARLLTDLGVPFRVQPADADESLLPGEDGADAAERLARVKAETVALTTDEPVLAADTLVVCDAQALGKPSSEDDARRMLRLLAGRSHQVVTGVCLISGGEARSARERTTVTLAAMTAAEIDWYVATGEPMDKAGAYNLYGRGGLFVESVAGSSSNVAGLPVRLVLRLARDARLALPLPPG